MLQIRGWTRAFRAEVALNRTPSSPERKEGDMAQVVRRVIVVRRTVRVPVRIVRRVTVRRIP